MNKFLTTLAAATAMAATASAQVVISEVRIDQSSTDNDEFFELAGAPGTSLDGLHYITIGDGAGGSGDFVGGTVEAVVDLAGMTIPPSGYFVCAESTFTLGTADLVADVNFENGDNVTHFLVSGFTGASGDDIDLDDDGVIDNVLWTSILDEVAMQETDPLTAGELLYSSRVVGPDGSFAVAAAQRETVAGLTAWTIIPFSDLAAHTPGSANPAGGISAAAGGTQYLFIDAGVGNAGNLYALGTTTTGTAPGIPVFGLTVPLNQSAILDFSVQNANGAVFQHTLNFLDGNGQNWANINLPPLAPSFVGTNAHTAGVVVDLVTLAGTTTVGPVALDILP